ncbi:hypothetical protein Tco_1379036 [Tanacetum coccineum]
MSDSEDSTLTTCSDPVILRGFELGSTQESGWDHPFYQRDLYVYIMTAYHVSTIADYRLAGGAQIPPPTGNLVLSRYSTRICSKSDPKKVRGGGMRITGEDPADS